MKTKSKYIFAVTTVIFIASIAVQLSGCGEENIINKIVVNEVTAKERLESAITQAKSDYGDSTRLVLIFGKNVNSNGKTEISAISAITSPDSIGMWLYIFRAPADTSLKIYTPNPLPTANNCIELTAFFNSNTLLNLIQDTSAKNIVAGALALLTTSGINITTSTSVLIDSDVSSNYANTTNPVIKFNSGYIPDTSSLNGNTFFSTGSDKTINMFLIPAAGTLNLPQFITTLTGFPQDLWVVNYKKLNSSNQTENLILGTVVESSQQMGVPVIGITSRVINLSKYVTE
jgi:hypothetical protein